MCVTVNQVPLIRDGGATDDIPIPEWTMQKHVPAVIDRLRTEIGGATFASKIFKTSSKGDKSKEQAAEAAVDINDLLVPKKKKRVTGGAKGKAKAKARAGSHDDKENIESILADVQQTGGVARERWWIDDVLAALVHAAGDGQRH